MNKFSDLIFPGLMTRDTKALFDSAKIIYNHLSEEEKEVIDGSDINLHKQIQYAIPSESNVAEELLRYVFVLLNNSLVETGLELLESIIIYCTWKVHFFIQNNVCKLLKIYQNEKEIYNYALFFLALDFKNRKVILENLKGARMPLWETLLNEMIKQKNYDFAETICREGILNQIPYGVDGYLKKAKIIDKLKQDEEDKFVNNKNFETPYSDENEFAVFYRKLKRELINNYLYEEIEITQNNNLSAMLYHGYPIYYLHLSNGKPLLYMDANDNKEDYAGFGVQIAIDKIPEKINEIKDVMEVKMLR